MPYYSTERRKLFLGTGNNRQRIALLCFAYIPWIIITQNLFTAPRPVGLKSVAATDRSSEQIKTRPSTPAMQLESEKRPNIEILTQRLDVHYEGYDDVEIDFGYSKAFLEKQLGKKILNLNI